MITVLQRVRQARVEVDGQVSGQIAQGLLVLVCAEQGDTEQEADKLLAKILKLRIFSDDAEKMNRSVQDVGWGALSALVVVVGESKFGALQALALLKIWCQSCRTASPCAVCRGKKGSGWSLLGMPQCAKVLSLGRRGRQSPARP